MWTTSSLLKPGSQVSATEQLHIKVGQFSTGLVAFSHELASEPSKGLLQVMQHVHSSTPSLVQTKQQMRTLQADVQALSAEMQDAVQGLHDIHTAGQTYLASIDTKLKEIGKQATSDLPHYHEAPSSRPSSLPGSRSPTPPISDAGAGPGQAMGPTL